MTLTMPEMDHDLRHQVEVVVDSWFALVEQTVHAQRSIATAMLGITVPGFVGTDLMTAPRREQAGTRTGT